MNKQQTAVEWLFGQIKKDIIGLEYDYADELEQAKEMEKEHMIEFAENSLDYLLDNSEDLILLTTQDRIEHFYNETYGYNK
jgi:hypothetical protein